MLTGAFAALLASSAAAHDFWIQPASFRLEPGMPAPLTLQVGHGDQRQRSPIRIGRISRFTASGPDGEVDLLPRLHPGEPASDGDIALPRPGTYVLALETDRRAESHLPADRYNDYLRAEGLTPALELRERTGRKGVDGSESYGRVAKALVQVGADPGPQAQVARPLGLELEIVTEANPYALPRPGSLPVRVYYRGQPLAGATVKLTDLDHDAAPLATRLTDGQGRASFAMPSAGSWQLNVVWTRPLPASSSTEFETVFSSLSFGAR